MLEENLFTEDDNQTWTTISEPIIITVFSVLCGWFKTILGVTLNVLKCFLIEIHAMELLFISMSNIYGFLCQLLFLTMCEIAILGEPQITNDEDDLHKHQGIVGLSALLFYSVFGYFVAKIRDICLNDWARSEQVRYSTSHYVKWIFKIILEWAKAIAVVLCIRDKGINYPPNLAYTTTTFLYYICTEKQFVDLFIKLVGCFNFIFFDCMEHLYVPIIFNVHVIACGIVLTVYMFGQPQIMYALFASYFILYLRMKDLYYNYIKELMIENQTYASFRYATEKDIQKWDDICAVCLNRMSKAMITPCNHLFHPLCLKQCLRTSLQCPLCKYDFIQ